MGNADIRVARLTSRFGVGSRGLISGDACRRENGFPEDDAPTPREFRNWLLLKIASGSSTPEQVGAAVKALGVDLGVLPEIQAPTREAPSPPSIADHPVRDMPDTAALGAGREPSPRLGQHQAARRPIL